jgi:hypothetical protein
LDGLLDDEVWTQAVRTTQFVQRNPVEGAPATEATDVFIAYDSANLYFGFHAHYSESGLVRANRSDRNVNYSRLVDPRDGRDVFSVTILRSLTTYQFTERLLLRSILEYARRDVRRQPPGHLSGQFGHGVLRGLRRSLPAG